MKTEVDLKMLYKRETGLDVILTAYGFRPYLAWLEERLLKELNKEIESEQTVAGIHNPDWGRVFIKDTELPS